MSTAKRVWRMLVRKWQACETMVDQLLEALGDRAGRL